MGRITQIGRPTARKAHRAGRATHWPYASARPDRPQSEEDEPRGRTTAARSLVLVVDDEAPVRMICSFNLEAAGLEVIEAVDGDDALGVTRERRPDLVLLDVMMPNRDGWAVAVELQADPRTRNIPIVFLTARVDDVDRRRAQQLGAVGYITKPFDPIVLASRLETILERIARGEREQLRSELLHNRER
jgi:CheY-like chemotaxis protein